MHKPNAYQYFKPLSGENTGVYSFKIMSALEYVLSFIRPAIVFHVSRGVKAVRAIKQAFTDSSNFQFSDDEEKDTEEALDETTTDAKSVPNQQYATPQSPNPPIKTTIMQGGLLRDIQKPRTNNLALVAQISLALALGLVAKADSDSDSEVIHAVYAPPAYSIIHRNEFVLSQTNSTNSFIEEIADSANPDSAIPVWLESAMTQLENMHHLPQDWSGEDIAAPNAAAIDIAQRAVTILAEAGLGMPKITPSVEEGIALTYLKGRDVGMIEIYNSGEIVVMLSDFDKNPRAWEIEDSPDSLRRAAIELSQFLQQL